MKINIQKMGKMSTESMTKEERIDFLDKLKKEYLRIIALPFIKHFHCTECRKCWSTKQNLTECRSCGADIPTVIEIELEN